MFYSGEHSMVLDLGRVRKASHAPDLSYLILFLDDGETFTLHGEEARRCCDLLANRCHEQGDVVGSSALHTLLAGVREIAQVRRVAGAGRR